jgi:ribonuclease HI
VDNAAVSSPPSSTPGAADRGANHGATHEANHEAIREVIRRERLLLDKDFRANTEKAVQLLHPDFAEHGASGARWDRVSIAAALSSEQPEPITMDEVDATALAADVVLLTYVARSGHSATLRSSVWVRSTRGEWLLRFHQGTPAQK